MKKNRGIDKLKSRYGWLFISTWLIGVVLFFAVPMIQSLIYSFSQISITENGVEGVFKGFKNYNYIINEHPDFLKWLGRSIVSYLYSLPVIVLLSMILALLLNQNFRGRFFFRALYFTPVIIASGIVIKYITALAGNDISSSSVNDSVSVGMFSVQDIITMLNLPGKVAVYVQNIIENIFNLIWNSGIQTVLFLAGLQSIPSTLYEASKVEGATKWEEFWFITFPMLSNVTLLVLVYTSVELFISNRNSLIVRIYDLMRSAVYDESSAMMWLYFLVIGFIMLIVLGIYKKFLQNRWS